MKPFLTPKQLNSTACNLPCRGEPVLASGVSGNPSTAPAMGGKTFASPHEVMGRVQAIMHHGPACCRIVAKTASDKWCCLSCAAPHIVVKPGAYSASNHTMNEKPRRRALVASRRCQECGKPSSSLNKRLCERHRRMAARRKARGRERYAAAVLDILHPGCTSAFENQRPTMASK